MKLNPYRCPRCNETYGLTMGHHCKFAPKTDLEKAFAALRVFALYKEMDCLDGSAFPEEMKQHAEIVEKAVRAGPRG